MVVVGVARLRLWRLLMVVLVQLVDVETVTSLMHVDAVSSLVIHGRLDLDGLGPVAFLSVQLTSIHRLNIQDAAIATLVTRAVVRGGNDGLAGWIESKVRLVHQLVIEARVDIRVVVLDGLRVLCCCRVHLRTILE